MKSTFTRLSMYQKNTRKSMTPKHMSQTTSTSMFENTKMFTVRPPQHQHNQQLNRGRQRIRLQ